MGWITPLTAVGNAALTAAQWNGSVRDNLNETEAAKATSTGRLIATAGANALVERDFLADVVGAAETTASGGWVDLATVGPDVTLVTGTKAIVSVSCYTSNNVAGGRGWMSHQIAGASTASAYDRWAAVMTSSGVNETYGASHVSMWTTLTAGSSQFLSKYRTSTAGTSTFVNRRIAVIGL